MTTRSAVRAGQWIVLAAVVVALAWAATWRLSGNHWERVQTPSMGTQAPVGSLLWVEPVPFDTLRVGDFITFTPPGESGQTYSHLIAAIDPDGTLRTKGAITSLDPWNLTSTDVVGEVVMTWRGAGWLVEAAPLLLVGAVIVRIASRRTADPRWRTPVTVVGAALLLSLAVVIYRPLVGAERLSFAAVDGGARATYVSTGLLPVRVQAYEGPHTVLRAGEVGSVTVTVPGGEGAGTADTDKADTDKANTDKADMSRYSVSLHPALEPWWWLLLVLACFVPALWTAVFGRPEPSAPQHLAVSSPSSPT